MVWKILRKNSHNNSGIQPSVNPPKTLAELEKEIAKQAQIIQSQQRSKPRGSIGSSIIWITILMGIPVGVVWVANLPYAVVRRPVVQNAPFLLLPSYMNIDNHYRKALTSIEQAEQLIEKPTSSADLSLGEQQLQQTKQHLENLPTGLVNDGIEYKYWWYDSRFSVYGLNTARSRVGQLEAKVFQEKNAQVLLNDYTQVLSNAKQQYQQATTVTDKKSAIASWRTALDQLEQIPGETLAGKTAQNQLDGYKRDFQEVVGLAAGNERISALITAAKQFSWQAAKAGQNPPHTVTEWQQIANLWSEAIERLKEVPDEDVVGYAEAQKLLATYETNLGQVKVRQKSEADSIEALTTAQQEIENLLASMPNDSDNFERNRVIGRLHSIINQLENVENGTTAYLKAQELLLSAKNKLQELQ